MVGVGIAIATAGIIVGAVGSTGLSTNLIIVIEFIAKDNVVILLFLTIILCLLLGMGLPTTANYVVVASLMATVLVDVGNASGFVFPLIAVHLFVFYFGLMADVTPPVGLASYAAAAISGGDPLKTGLQAFWYSLRIKLIPYCSKLYSISKVSFLITSNYYFFNRNIGLYFCNSSLVY